MKLHGVSRITIKQAIRTLVDKGLVETVQGRGTFVSEDKHQWELSKLHSFSEDMRRRGFEPGSRIIKKEICRGAVPELNLENNDALTICVKRLRLANDEPMAIEIMQLDYEMFSSIYDDIIDNCSMYKLIEERVGLNLSYANEYLEASLPDKEEIELLKIGDKTSVFRLKRVSYTSNGLPVELTTSVYRGDKYRFKFTLER
jgi:GntR family transcriptional regulator